MPARCSIRSSTIGSSMPISSPAGRGVAPNRAFQSPLLGAIDEERRRQYELGGGRWETECVLTAAYRPPKKTRSRVAGVFATGGEGATDWRAEWERYRRALMDLEDRFRGRSGSPARLRRSCSRTCTAR